MTNEQDFSYRGGELPIFASASRWKSYWASRIGRWIRGDVLEVGAGLGVNTSFLYSSSIRSWHCIEPDPDLASKLSSSVSNFRFCLVSTGTISSVRGQEFDSILYIDVLEHIEADADELARAAALLRQRGHIIVLAPAHQFLFSEFDAAIGHHRRYNKQSLRACSPAGCRLEAMFYLDSIGMLASLANRFMLRQNIPTAAQIRNWDSYMIPMSRRIDAVLRYSIGKTICGVWQRDDTLRVA